MGWCSSLFSGSDSESGHSIELYEGYRNRFKTNRSITVDPCPCDPPREPLCAGWQYEIQAIIPYSGNFPGVQFSQMGTLRHFAGSIFANIDVHDCASMCVCTSINVQ